MTDRVKGFIVTLDKEMRIDDAKELMDAIKCMRRVISVEPSVDNFEDRMNRERVRRELGEKLWEVLYPKDK